MTPPQRQDRTRFLLGKLLGAYSEKKYKEADETIEEICNELQEERKRTLLEVEEVLYRSISDKEVAKSLMDSILSPGETKI